MRLIAVSLGLTFSSPVVAIAAWCSPLSVGLREANKSMMKFSHENPYFAADDISVDMKRLTFTSCHPTEVSAILRDAWDGFRRGFVLAYAGRAGLGVMTRALTLVRRRQFSDALGWRLLSEKTLVYRRAALPALRGCKQRCCVRAGALPHHSRKSCRSKLDASHYSAWRPVADHRPSTSRHPTVPCPDATVT